MTKNYDPKLYLGMHIALTNLGIGFLKLGAALALRNGYKIQNTQVRANGKGLLFFSKGTRSIEVPILVPNLDFYDEILVMLSYLHKTVPDLSSGVCV